MQTINCAFDLQVAIPFQLELVHGLSWCYATLVLNRVGHRELVTKRKIRNSYRNRNSSIPVGIGIPNIRLQNRYVYNLIPVFGVFCLVLVCSRVLHYSTLGVTIYSLCLKLERKRCSKVQLHFILKKDGFAQCKTLDKLITVK